MMENRASSKKAQGSPEFTAVASFVLLTFVAIMLTALQKQSDSYNFEVFLDAKRVALALAENIDMISQNGNGYYRYFSVPETLYGFTDYGLDVSGNFVWINYTGTAWSTQVITDNATIVHLARGENETNCIINRGGEIILNQTCQLP